MKQVVGFEEGGNPRRKCSYYTKQRTSDSMSDDRKAGVAAWNEMVTVLQENGLMKEKDED